MSADGLDGRVAIVTGARGNLGPVWCSALREAGAVVVGVDVRAGQGVEQADVTDRASLDRVLERIVAEHGTPSVLVNNAGIDTPPGADASASFRKTLDVNVFGVFNATEVFGTAMRDAGRGSIVNIGSLYASVAPEPSFYDHFDPPFHKPPAYGASKAGVVSLTRHYARLWGPNGVRVNALSPGGVRGGQDEQFVRKYAARVPLGRMAEPSDLVGPLLFLASDASAYVTGHELRVDGGFTA
jgi:NAD(P)-dependent dehydrogenase (short-subunit alcohol dehydrogenase family)